LTGNRTDIEALVGRGLRIITDKGKSGIVQSQFWKELELNSRDGSRLAISLEKRSLITRVRFFENGRWTYRLLPTKLQIGMECIESAPCLSCPVEHMCSIDSLYSPHSCSLVEDWITVSFHERTQIGQRDDNQNYPNHRASRSEKPKKRRLLAKIPKGNMKTEKSHKMKWQRKR
jgi:hypothetical protein